MEVSLVTKEESNWDDILIDSFNYCGKQYDYKEVDNIEQFWNIIGKESVYVCINQNRAIGFFFLEGDTDLTFKLFMYPRACPMSLRSLLKAALYRFMLETTKSDISSLRFKTWHPSILSLAKMYFPDATICNYSPSDFEFKLETIDGARIQTLLEKYNKFRTL